MKKKVISALLCAAMVATMLVGCGGNSNDSKSSGGDGKKLVYWAMWSKDEPQAKVIQDAIAKYTEDTGVEVDVQFKGRSGQREGLQPALDAKQTIDLFDEDVNRVNGSWGKYLLDLEDVAKDYESEHGNETLFKIARAAYEDGTLHSIPYQPSIFGFFYNKTLFDKAGIKEVPTTWDELTAACKAIKEYDDSIYPWGIDMTTDEGQAAFAYYTWNNGGGFVDDDGNWTLNSPENVEAIEYAISLVNDGYTNSDPANDTRYDLQDMFGAGKIAMVIAPNSLPTYIADGGNEVNYGVASIPSNTGESVSAGVMDRFMCFDNEYTDEEKAAITTFFDYFYDDDRYTDWVAMEGFLPATKTGGEALAAADPDMASWIDILASCKFYPTAKAEWADVKQGVISAEQNALLGESVQEQLDNLQAEIAG